MTSSAVFMALRIITALCSFMVVLSPAPAIYRIYKNKDVGHLTIFPLASLLINSHMWMLYGYFRGNIFPVMVSFGFGDIATAIYIVVYYHYAPPSQKRKFLYVLGVLIPVLVIITVYGVVAGLGATDQTNNQISHIMGYIGVVTAIALYGAPFFERVVVVMRTKNAECIQIVMVIAGFANNATWSIYTILDENWIQLIPNAVCVPLGVIMILLYILYKPRHESTTCLSPLGAENAISIVIETPKSEMLEKERTTSIRYEPLVSPLAPVHAVTITSAVRGGEPAFH